LLTSLGVTQSLVHVAEFTKRGEQIVVVAAHRVLEMIVVLVDSSPPASMFFIFIFILIGNEKTTVSLVTLHDWQTLARFESQERWASFQDPWRVATR